MYDRESLVRALATPVEAAWPTAPASNPSTLPPGATVASRTREAFLAVDLDGVVVGWNPAAERLLGWDAEQVLERPAVDVVVPERHRETFEARLAVHRLRGTEQDFLSLDEETALVLLAAGGREVRVAGRIGALASAREGLQHGPCVYALLHDAAADARDEVELVRDLERLDAEERSALSPEVPVRTTDAAASVVAGRVLAFARELLGLDVLWVSRFEGRRLVFVLVDGDAGLLGGVAGDHVPAATSFCSRVVDGRIPNAVPDVAEDPRTATLPAADGEDPFGAFLGVPLRGADGRDHGTLCGATRGPRPELGEAEVALLDALADTVADVVDQAESDVVERRSALRTQAISALSAALEARDGCTADHSRSVVALSLAVALELDLPDALEEEVAHVALLHDVGKLGVPDNVLRHRGAFDARERRLMDAHATIGARLVGRVSAIAHLAPAVRAVHERWDGEGYPDRLAGEAIPLASRICFACDAWDAMTSDQPYREAMGDQDALAELRREAGHQFDPRVVDALVAVLRRWR